MAMRALDPATDHALRERDLERKEARATHTLHIDDLLSEPIEVDGVKYDVKVTVTLKRHGKKGPIEIDYMDISQELYILVPNLSEPLLVSRSAFNTRHELAHKRLENAIDLRALSFGLASNDWEMEDCE